MRERTDGVNSSIEQNGNEQKGATLNGQAPEASRAARIAALNDGLRRHGCGGLVLVTNGIACLEPSTVRAILNEVAAFDAFTPDNDPWNEHDCAALTVKGVNVLWKIDYYDRQRQFHSPDPADPKLTVRVLTIMLAEEY